MVELGELEKKYADFEKRKLNVFVISNDDRALSQKTQEKFPHLKVVSDPEQKMAKAMEVIHPGAAPDGKDSNAPTTFLVDGTGTVRWLFRPDKVLVRLSPEELLTAIDGSKKGT
jgi:peroxiredoxin